MEWWILLLLIFGGLIFLMFKGLPIAFSFLLMNIIVITIFHGLRIGSNQMILNIYDALTKFSLSPIPLFILMGEVLFQSGMAFRILEALSKLLGAMPGRLSVLTVSVGALFAAMSGSNLANAAMLGSMMMPDMLNKGYHKSMIIGPILSSGGLAMIIPPSSLAVLFASLAKISVAKLLIANIVPGFLLVIMFIMYIMIRCALNPDLAPFHKTVKFTLTEKLIVVIKIIMPIMLLIFLTIGVIFTGVATPTEAAALGAGGSFVLAAFYRRLNFEMVKKSVLGTIRITVMIFMIIAASTTFSQLLAFSGATRSFVEIINGLEASPIIVLILMQLIVLFLGAFMDQISIMMITLPLFVPLIISLKLDLIWFAVIMLINLEVAMLTPPVGLLLFVMKGMVPKEITMKDIYVAVFPFIIINILVITLLIVFPPIAIWLPNLYQ